jgi:hypothetical protein
LLGTLRRFALRNVFFTMLGMVGISETLILQWVLVAAGLPGFGWLAGVALAIGLALANAATLMGLRALSWSNRAVYVLSRAYMLVSLGALITGPILALALLLAALPASFGFPSTAQTALVGGGGLAVALGFGSILWGFLVGQRKVVVDEVELPIRDLPPPLEGLEIAHITDLHIGRQLRAPRLRSFVAQVNAVGADLIVITGDIFDFDEEFIEEGCRELAALEAPLGVYAILGNHDVYTGREEVAQGSACFATSGRRSRRVARSSICSGSRTRARAGPIATARVPSWRSSATTRPEARRASCSLTARAGSGRRRAWTST